MKICDLFSGAGGAAMGYHRAGFDEVVGVDIALQPRYPFEFHQADAFAFLRDHHGEFDAFHASPECRDHTALTSRAGLKGTGWQLPEVRRLLEEIGKPYVIENVPGAPMRKDAVLCGGMFGLRTYRHRLFEANWPLIVPQHFGGSHAGMHTKMGRPWQPGTLYQAVGNFSGVDFVRQDLGVPWMNRDGIRECIPPAYGRFIGLQLMAHLLNGARAPVA